MTQIDQSGQKQVWKIQERAVGQELFPSKRGIAKEGFTASVGNKEGTRIVEEG